MADIQHQKPDIVPVVSQHVHLQRTGKDYTGSCPFHTEKTPSFTVSPAKQIYHCFGCGAGGDVIAFIQAIKGYDFKEACAELSIDTGHDTHIRPSRRISSARRRKNHQRRQQRQEQITQAVQTWAWWYEGVLAQIIESLDYILPRITPDELEYFAGCIHRRAIWEHHLTIIQHGTDEDLYELWADQN